MKQTSVLLLILLLIGVTLRSLIPAGFMASGSAGVALTICSGLETKTIFVQDTQAPVNNHKQDKHEACPFAPPVLADHSSIFQLADYIPVAYTPFHPHRTDLSFAHHVPVKPFDSQGPPARFAV